MKKIRNIKDIENEKLRLRVKQLELERQMERSWQRLKYNLATGDESEKKNSRNNIDFKTRSTFLNNGLGYVAGFLSHKAGMLAGKKVEIAAEQLLGTLAEKINLFVSKRKKT